MITPPGSDCAKIIERLDPGQRWICCATCHTGLNTRPFATYHGMTVNVCHRVASLIVNKEAA